jgi:uncharacterized coiled-coil protein SlyX
LGWNCAFRVIYRLDILITVNTPQNKIIEALEAEVARLKTQLSDTEDRLLKMRGKFDDMAIKLYGGGRN